MQWKHFTYYLIKHLISLGSKDHGQVQGREKRNMFSKI